MLLARLHPGSQNLLLMLTGLRGAPASRTNSAAKLAILDLAAQRCRFSYRFPHQCAFTQHFPHGNQAKFDGMIGSLTTPENREPEYFGSAGPEVGAFPVFPRHLGGFCGSPDALLLSEGS